jgi:hypothetical protein
VTYFCVVYTDCLRLDEQATSKMLATVDIQSQTAQDLDVCHRTAVSDIQCQSDDCLNNDYLVNFFHLLWTKS